MIDTETTTDVTQRFLYGCFRYLCRRPGTNLWDCYAEGLVYADDLPVRDPEAFALLADYAATRLASVTLTTTGDREPDWRLRLMSRTEFTDKWWHHVGFAHTFNTKPAALVFFNAPFDISRLATGVADARRDMLGGFSYKVFTDTDGAEHPYRPRVAVKNIDSKRSLKKYRAVETGQTKKADYSGHFVDLRTVVFALTGKGYSLQSACDAYGVAGKAATPELGIVTAEAIDYCRRDVDATAGLFAAVVVDFERHPVDLQMTQAYSPASFAKSYLDAMGLVAPLAEGGPAYGRPAGSDELQGIAMSAFYGGRAECRIRHTPVPVVVLDFTSMYPTANALMGSWNLLTAEAIDLLDGPQNTELVQAFLDALAENPDVLFDRSTWPIMLTLGQIVPDGDVLPVRAGYREGDWTIGVNYFTDRQGTPHWYALGDLVASTILTGKAPRLLTAITLIGHGTQSELRPVKLRDEVEIDPRHDEFFTRAIELRAQRKRDHGDKDKVAAFAKMLANAGGYGVFAQMTPDDHPATVALHTGLGDPITKHIARPEQPGPWCYPPLAACITATARLLLAMMEHEVVGLGGRWAFCDTDSMAIVATVEGGDLIPCEGGPHSTADGKPAVRALSGEQVQAIRAKFNRLSPYDPELVEHLLTEDYVGTCLAISAKRYAIYRHGPDGAIVWPEKETKFSEHGLGQFLDPIDPDADPTEETERPWVRQVWEWIIRRHDDPDAQMPSWVDRAAHARITVTSPRLLRPFEMFNDGKSWDDQIKPANFGLVPTLDPFGVPEGLDPERFRLIGPYKRHAADDTEWRNLYDPAATPVEITTDFATARPDQAVVKSYAQVIREYRIHPEHKFLGPNGQPCTTRTRGLLARDHITPERIVIIGKESNRLEDVEAGLVNAPDVTTVYDDGADDHLRRVTLPALSHLGDRELGRLARVSHTTIKRIRDGSKPRRDLMRRLAELANRAPGADVNA